MNRADRNKLVVENLPLVGYLVAEACWRATHLSRDDLASAGAVALVTAAGAFKPELGIPFGAYARRRIVGAIQDEMRASDWAPRNTRTRIKETLAVQESLSAALGRTPSVDELAQSLGVERDVVQATLADASRTVAPIDEVLGEVLAADAPLPEDLLLETEELRYLHAAVAALPERMRRIIEQVYFEDRPVGEIAEEAGITHSAVSQQRSEAIRLLRDGLRTSYAEEEGRSAEPESRVSAASRTAYLERIRVQLREDVARSAHSDEERLRAAI